MLGFGSRVTWRDLRMGCLIVGVAVIALVFRLRLDEPPRYDGAGYATLARGLAAGSGYRDITHPDRPPHAHFPPGYPIALAILFRAFGASPAGAHLFSVACTLVGVWSFWRVWSLSEDRWTAELLALALACNWTWGRIGGSIQSEPLYLALSGSMLLLASRPIEGRGIARGVGLGLLAGACFLTRHVGACLVPAFGLNLALRGKKGAAATMIGAAAAVVAPWLAWQASVGRGTQAGLFRGESLASLVAGQVVFYARRLPDQVFGPFVEVATVFGRSAAVAGVATAGAAGFALVVLIGWVRLASDPGRRLGGLVPLLTFPLLLAWPFTEAGRFLVPLVPFLLGGAAEGLAWSSGRPRKLAAATLLAASLPYSAYSLISDREGARIRTHAPFDAACRWIGARADHPGPVLARHPADVAWIAGRLALAADGDEIEREIDRREVAFLLVDDFRYANAPPSALRSFAEARGDRVRLAWGGLGPVRVYEVIQGQGRARDATPVSR